MQKFINKIIHGDCIEEMKKIEDLTNKIICSNAIKTLQKIPDESINCVVTSPPYFNLRSYLDEKNPFKKSEIGLEKTWQNYLENLINIFDEIKRILKKDGTCFVNIGDSYAGGGKGRNGDGTASKSLNKNNKGTRANILKRCDYGKIQAKSLMAIPARFQIKMIEHGWINRNDIIWTKVNAMPESVNDRFKKAHEYIFFFTKNKHYYFDLDSIRTPHKAVSLKRAEYEQGRNALGHNVSSMGKKYNRDKKNKDGTEKYYSMPARVVKLNPKGAVPPDYFSINTNCSEQDTIEGHYATFPQSLIIPLIKAGCPKNGIVCDPFAGSCTTALVAEKLNRKWIMIDISKKYCKIGQDRMDTFIAQKRLF